MTLKTVKLLLIILLFASCKHDLVFTKYTHVTNNTWHKDSIVRFKVDITDTISKHAVYLNLRNDKDYEFNNLFLIVDVDYPNKTKISDTLEYKMTDEKGFFLGTGYTDIKENKLELKEHMQFPVKGIYTYNIQQAMRKNGEEQGVVLLNGITDVGLEIEKITHNNDN